MATFTDKELEYLKSQRLARLATANAEGAPHVVPVGFRLSDDATAIEVGGHNFARSKKYRDMQANPKVANRLRRRAEPPGDEVRLVARGARDDPLGTVEPRVADIAAAGGVGPGGRHVVVLADRLEPRGVEVDDGQVIIGVERADDALADEAAADDEGPQLAATYVVLAHPASTSLRSMAARSRWLGVLVAAGSLTLTTLLLYPLGEVAPPVSLGVLYLLAVLLVSTVWGLGLGLLTSAAAALAFNFFHIPPTGRFTIADAENWVALAVFLVAAVVASSLSDAARSRAAEAERRRREADLAAELARLLLGSPEPRAALALASKRIADALQIDSATVLLEPVPSGDRRAAVPLGDVGTLLVPTGAEQIARDRVAPALEALLRAALEREALTREVVETSALRRSDDIKTAVLRSVSHDLRSPLTAIVAAAAALASPAIEPEERIELVDSISHESQRLARLVDQLLDLSRLEAGSAEPREDWCSLDEVIRAAVEDAGAGERVKLAIAPDLPLIRADAGQLRRAVANLLENALRYGDHKPVSVRARVSGGRLLMRVVDQGPGIPPAEQERIFAPFYRGSRAEGRGSGLGLAIVRGLVEANGGRVRVESLPGQGSSFVVELPLPAPVEAPA
jgi:two-component system sensor histidine kinase KdpD